MTVSEKEWQRYIDDLRKVNDTAADLVRQYLQRNGIPNDRAALNALLEYCNAVCSRYSEASATLAAEMYDALAALSGASVPPALPAPVPEMDDVARSVVGTMKTGNEEIISNAIGRLVKQTGVDTTIQNAIRDGAYLAWIPRGDTCAFCIALASRGWQRASKKLLKNGHAEHIHANCDCTHAVQFDGKPNYAGYDPDEFLNLYNGASRSHDPTEKINAMRREFYRRNSEEINAQKRSAYEKRQERESSAAEEMDV